MCGHDLAARIGQRIPRDPMPKLESRAEKRDVAQRPPGAVEHEETATRLERIGHAREPGVAPIKVTLVRLAVVVVPVIFFEIVRRVGECEIKRSAWMQFLYAMQERHAVTLINAVGFE